MRDKQYWALGLFESHLIDYLQEIVFLFNQRKLVTAGLLYNTPTYYWMESHDVGGLVGEGYKYIKYYSLLGTITHWTRPEFHELEFHNFQSFSS